MKPWEIETPSGMSGLRVHIGVDFGEYGVGLFL
jgi:hypothetical protein